MSRAFLLKDGKPRSMPSAEAEGIASDHDFLWLHLDGRDESAIATIQSDEGIPAIARSAMLAHETRPRCAVLNGGALINLRGLGSTPADEIGRASCRERVCTYVSISLVAVSSKQNKTTNK